MSTIFRLSVYFMLSFSQTFQNNLDFASPLSIRGVMKFYYLGRKSFETDFNYQCDSVVVW